MKEYRLSENHYLSIANRIGHQYYNDFGDALDILSEVLSGGQLKSLEGKLQLNNRGRFDEDQFVQIACETTVCAYFAKLFPSSFRYELRCNSTNRKDVDCQFTDGKYTYNVEVKCPGLNNYKQNSGQAFKFEAVGRSDDEGRQMSDNIMGMLNDSFAGEPSQHRYRKHKSLDNTLKSFLQDAHSKFPSVELTDVVNMLVVCCDDASDTQRWMNYLYQEQGLFTNNSFCNAEQYNRVDVIIISNLLNRHYLFDSKRIEGNSWELNDAFSLAFDNPVKYQMKQAALLNLLYRFPHYSYFLADYISEDIGNVYAKKYRQAFGIIEILPKLEGLLSEVNKEEFRFFASRK